MRVKAALSACARPIMKLFLAIFSMEFAEYRKIKVWQVGRARCQQNEGSQMRKR